MKINHTFQINSLLKMILIVFNFYLRKIVLQEVGGKSFDCFCPIYRLCKNILEGPGGSMSYATTLHIHVIKIQEKCRYILFYIYT